MAMPGFFRFGPLLFMHKQLFRLAVPVLKVVSSVPHILVTYRSVAEVFHKRAA